MDEYTACLTLDAAADHEGVAEIYGIGLCRPIIVFVTADARPSTTARRGYLLVGKVGWLVRDGNGKLVVWRVNLDIAGDSDG